MLRSLCASSSFPSSNLLTELGLISRKYNVSFLSGRLINRPGNYSRPLIEQTYNEGQNQRFLDPGELFRRQLSRKPTGTGNSSRSNMGDEDYSGGGGDGASFKSKWDTFTSKVRNLKLGTIEEAPPGIFWLSAVSLTPVALSPWVSLVFSHSPVLFSMQYNVASCYLAFVGGTLLAEDLRGSNLRWDSAVSGASLPVIAAAASIMPSTLGSLALCLGSAVASITNVSSTNLPQWYRALSLIFSSVTLLSLSLTFVLRVI